MLLLTILYCIVVFRIKFDCFVPMNDATYNKHFFVVKYVRNKY